MSRSASDVVRCFAKDTRGRARPITRRPLLLLTSPQNDHGSAKNLNCILIGLCNWSNLPPPAQRLASSFRNTRDILLTDALFGNTSFSRWEHGGGWLKEWSANFISSYGKPGCFHFCVSPCYPGSSKFWTYFYVSYPTEQNTAMVILLGEWFSLTYHNILAGQRPDTA